MFYNLKLQLEIRKILCNHTKENNLEKIIKKLLTTNILYDTLQTDDTPLSGRACRGKCGLCGVM